MFPLPRFDFVNSVSLSDHCAALARNLSRPLAESGVTGGGDGLDLVEEPEELFERLSRGSTTLAAVELFSLLVWDSEAWEREPAERVVRHLWNSIVHQSDLRQIALYRVLLANKEKWPGPDPLIRLLSNDLKTRLLLQWPDKSQARVLMCLANEDAQGLADVIIKAHDADLPVQYLRRLKLLGRLPVAEAALPFWIAGWAGLKPGRRTGLARQTGLPQVLADLDFTRSLQVAQVILEDEVIRQKMQATQESWPELEIWFRQRNSDALWRNGLTDLQRQRLEQWLRSVSFRDFQRWSRRIIDALPKILDDPKKEEQEKNQLDRRVTYWQNYQQQFQQVRFLLPSETLEVLREEDKSLEVGANVSVLGEHRAGCEVGIFHIGKYCLVEFFRGKQSELRILKEEYATQLFTQARWTLEGLRELPYEWIQDHNRFWQSELVFVLDRIFDVRPDKTNVFFGERQSFMYGGEWVLKSVQQIIRDEQIKKWAYHLDEAGKRKWAQQRRSIDQLLGRVIESPEPVEFEAPACPIQPASDKTPVRRVSGWYKVDDNGLRLPADASYWAAVCDAKSGLMWAVNILSTVDFPNPSGRVQWDTACMWEQEVNESGWCGFHDWRLPTEREIEDLLNSFEVDVIEQWLKVKRNFWSGTEDEFIDHFAYFLDLELGMCDTASKRFSCNVRLVRVVTNNS